MFQKDKVRLVKVLAQAGIGSRRSVEKLIAAGLVKVNKAIVKQQGVKVDPEIDQIEIMGQKLKPKEKHEYWWVNKPAGIVSSKVSQIGEPTVVELVNSQNRLYPVGRLDKESRGLMLLTNDGELTHRLTHPKWHVTKTYLVTVKGKVLGFQLAKFTKGMMITDTEKTKPARVEIIEKTREATQLEFKLEEGKFRQIRRMLGYFGFEVMDLVRTAIGKSTLGKLAEGKARKLSPDEVGKLKKGVGLG